MHGDVAALDELLGTHRTTIRLFAGVETWPLPLNRLIKNNGTPRSPGPGLGLPPLPVGGTYRAWGLLRSACSTSHSTSASGISSIHTASRQCGSARAWQRSSCGRTALRKSTPRDQCKIYPAVSPVVRLFYRHYRWGLEYRVMVHDKWSPKYAIESAELVSRTGWPIRAVRSRSPHGTPDKKTSRKQSNSKP